LFGTDLSKTVHNSCFVIAYPPIEPQWGIYFHELGHNFTNASRRFVQFRSSGTLSTNRVYIEGLATLLSMFVSRTVAANPGDYGLSNERAQAMLSQSYFGPGDRFNGYLATGPDYASLDPSILDDILAILMNEYGNQWVSRFFAVFSPQTTEFPFAIDSIEQQATLFVAAVSAAIQVDLRFRFGDIWGFPLDQSFYDLIYPEIRRAAGRRERHVRIMAHPQSQMVGSAAPATLAVVAAGMTPLGYQWYRGPSGATGDPIAGATSSSYTTPALTNFQHYWVRVSNEDGYVDSRTALVNISFTDSTLTPTTNAIRRVHITELRARVDVVRERSGLPAFSYTDPTIVAGTTSIKIEHVTELRTALSQAYAAAGRTSPTYTDPNLSSGMPIRAVHVVELRAAVIAIE
jgi:hypothetical protein